MKIKYLIIVMLCFFMGICTTNAAQESQALDDDNNIALLANETDNTSSPNYCEGLKPTFVFIGHIIRLAKILIPIIIIIFGMLDFFKAITGSKDDEIRKSAKSLLFRALAGVCIFFLPAIIDFIFSLVDGWSNSEYESNYQSCFKCVWDVGSCTK